MMKFTKQGQQADGLGNISAKEAAHASTLWLCLGLDFCDQDLYSIYTRDDGTVPGHARMINIERANSNSIQDVDLG